MARSKNTLIGRLAIAAVTLLPALAGPATAATFKLVPFEFADGPLDDPLLTPIELTLCIEEDAGKLIFVILNSSDQNTPGVDGSRPAVTNIYIEDPNGILGGAGFGTFAGGFGTVAGEGVSYRDYRSGGNLPGGNNISFTESYFFSPETPSPKNGIDPGESGRFEVGTATVASAKEAIATNQVRVGVHVQQIGVFSASFVTTVPEPGTSLLCLFGGGALLLRRRRRPNPSSHQGTAPRS